MLWYKICFVAIWKLVRSNPSDLIFSIHAQWRIQWGQSGHTPPIRSCPPPPIQSDSLAINFESDIIRKKCTHCGQLILSKISKIGATRCQIPRLKCTKFYFRSAPHPAWEAYSAPPDSLAVFKRPTSKGRKVERGGEGKGRNEKGRVEEGRVRQGKGREGCPQLGSLDSLVSMQKPSDALQYNKQFYCQESDQLCIIRQLPRTNFLIPFGSLISLVHLSPPLCPQAPTLKLPSTCLMVCSILGSRPISFPNLFLLSSPSPTDWLLGKWIGTLLVVFGVVNLVQCPD